MDPQAFRPPFPGRLVSTTHGVQAFVPDPLPCGVELSGETVRLLAAAENAVGRLSGTTAREFNPFLIGSPLLHREAIASSRMEGTVTTPEQLVLLEAERQTPGRSADADDDTLEVLNYVHAMREGLELLEELPITTRLIREIHEVLLSGVRGQHQDPGEFRKGQNFIRSPRSERIEDARFIPPPVPEMRKALGDLDRYMNDPEPEDPLLVRLALVHYQFEAIHPFRDGNGRVGRLLIPLLLVANDRLQSPILYLSAFFETHRESYVDLMLRVSQTGDWASWLDFFLRAVRRSAEDSIRQAISLLELRQAYHRRLQAGRASARLIQLIDRLFQVPSITIKDAATVLDLTPQGAANNIHRLEEEGILREVTGRKRNQIFVADEILRFLYEPPDREP